MIVEPIPATARPRISSRARVQTDKVSGKPVLLYPEGVLMLNPTGHAIVSLCTGKATFDEIVADLAKQYNIPVEQILPEITEYLNRLRARKVVEFDQHGEKAEMTNGE